MRTVLFSLACAITSVCPTMQHRPHIVVAVIDTGIRPGTNVKLCDGGHYNFVDESYDITDRHGHGTNVAGLIDASAHDTDYCQVHFKYYSDNATGKENEQREIRALREAVEMKVNYINISGGGPEPDEQERALIKRALDAGIVIVTAAGNEGANLNKQCNYYPACYDKRIVVVGNLGLNKKRMPSSNWGNIVKHYVIGENRCALGLCLTGTSQATAIVTGRMIRDDYETNGSHSIRTDSE